METVASHGFADETVALRHATRFKVEQIADLSARVSKNSSDPRDHELRHPANRVYAICDIAVQRANCCALVAKHACSSRRDDGLGICQPSGANPHAQSNPAIGQL